MERWWGIVFFALTACEPEPRAPAQVVPEVYRFETEAIRREVDQYKNAPSVKARQRMEAAFAILDARVRGLEALAETQSSAERTATQQQIADLKRRRELHWTRSQTALAEAEPVHRAEPVAERAVKAERVGIPQRVVRKAERARTAETPRTIRTAPRVSPLNFFQQIFR